MKLSVSQPTFNELMVLLKRQGKDLNDGMTTLTIEKGNAIMPPYDFRIIAVKQNCLIGAAEIYKNNPALDFLEIAQDIFKWCLSGKAETKTED